MKEYQIIYSDRKSVCLEIGKDMNLIVRAPRFMRKSDVDRFVLNHNDWVDKHLEIRSRRNDVEQKVFSDVERLKKAAYDYIPKRLEYFSRLMNLKPEGVKITGATTRFGSCSGKNRLCFSYRLMAYPLQAVDYVIVHELAHIKYKNHGIGFYSFINEFMPDYKMRNALLKSPLKTE